MSNHLSFSDRLICHADNALKTLTPGAVKSGQQRPDYSISKPELSWHEKKHVAGLMRINHSGEVCAQALYQGQSLTAKLPEIRQSMEAAAEEELDHLAWCETRIKDLDGRTSFLNPIFYTFSYALGAIAGVAGDKWSLGFVAATEDQVSMHLKDHISQIEHTDPASTAILNKMLEDEERHAHNAIEAGGIIFHPKFKSLMTYISKIMTKASYKI